MLHCIVIQICQKKEGCKRHRTSAKADTTESICPIRIECCIQSTAFCFSRMLASFVCWWLTVLAQVITIPVKPISLHQQIYRGEINRQSPCDLSRDNPDVSNRNFFSVCLCYSSAPSAAAATLATYSLSRLHAKLRQKSPFAHTTPLNLDPCMYSGRSGFWLVGC